MGSQQGARIFSRNFSQGRFSGGLGRIDAGDRRRYPNMGPNRILQKGGVGYPDTAGISMA